MNSQKNLTDLRSQAMRFVETNLFLSPEDREDLKKTIPNLEEAELERLIGIFEQNKEELNGIIKDMAEKDKDGVLINKLKAFQNKEFDKIKTNVTEEEGDAVERELEESLKDL